jgi:hypothetical protein
MYKNMDIINLIAVNLHKYTIYAYRYYIKWALEELIWGYSSRLDITDGSHRIGVNKLG